MLRNLRNIEFSKRLLTFIEVLVLLCFGLVCISVFKGDSSPLVALITGVFSLASIAFGFYFWKAKNENIRKYAKTFNKEQIDQLIKLSKAFRLKDLEGDDNERI